MASTVRSAAELIEYAKEIYTKDPNASIFNYTIKKIADDKSDNVYLVLSINKAFASIKFKNCIVSSGVKPPFGCKLEAGDVPKSNMLIMFRKIERSDIEGGDFVPRVMANPAEQPDENARVDRIINNYVSSTNELVDVLTLIEQDFRTKLAPQIIKDAETDPTKAKLLKTIKAIRRKADDKTTVKLNAFIQKSYIDKETDETVDMEAPIARVKISVAKDGVIGYYIKGRHVPIIFNAKKMAQLKISAENPLPYTIRESESGAPEKLNYTDISDAITHKSVLSGIIKVDVNASLFGLSCSVSVNKLFVSTHSKSTGDKSFSNEDLDGMSMDSGIDKMTAKVAALKVEEEKKEEKKDDDESDIINADDDEQTKPVAPAPVKPKRKNTKY